MQSSRSLCFPPPRAVGRRTAMPLALLVGGVLLGCTLLGCAGDPASWGLNVGDRRAAQATAELAARLADGDRPAEDKARDADRKPAAVLTFLGIEPGMRVIDLIAAGGYYTEVLAEAVGPDGHVLAQNIAFVLQMRDGANDKAMTARLANGRLANVTRLDAEFDSLGLPPESLDAAITALNFHDILDGQGPETTARILDVVKRALVPGGVLGVIDHAGDPGQDALNKKLHRIDEARVVAALEEVGFEVEARSGALGNPSDDRTRNVFAEGLRGRTDRFVLRARKPR